MAVLTSTNRLLRLLFIGILPILLPGAFCDALFARPASLPVVDIMVLYTSDAREGAGGTAAIKNMIDLAMLEANQVFQNSQISARFRLVYKGEITYSESGSVSTDLARLRAPADGYLDDAQKLRDTYGADLVCLVTEYGPDYLFYGLQGPSASNAFSILRRPYLTGSNYLPVVLSFNFGCQLDAGHADSLGAFPYSYGFTFSANGKNYGTVEAPASQNRVPWFSNPNLFLLGTPTGLPEGEPGAANNAKTINNTAPLVASFRGTNNSGYPPRLQILPPAQPLPGAGESLTVNTSAADQDGFVSEVKFLLNGQIVGRTTNASFSFTLTNLPYGSNLVTAVAIDNSGLSSASLPISLTVTNSFNDQFAKRQVIVGDKVTFSGNNDKATAEPGEPNHLPSYWLSETPQFRSLWWEWIATSNGNLSIDLNGSEVVGLLSVYTGDALTNLVKQAATGGINALTLRVRRGVHYFFAGDTVLSNSQPIRGGRFQVNLSLLPSPLNDDFVDRTILSGRFAQFSVNSAEATNEPDEPNSNYGSIWWEWVAPTSGTLWITNVGYSGQQWFTLYSGQTLANLKPVPTQVTILGLAFDVVMNQTYALAYRGPPGAVQSKLALSTTTLAVASSSTTPGETRRFIYPADVPLTASVGPLTTRISRVDFVAVDAINSSKPRQLLASVSNPPYSTIWSQPPLGSYLIYAQAIEDDGEIMPSVPVMTLIAPANDRLADAPQLTGDNLLMTGDTRGAAVEPEEPYSPYWGAPGRSVWWDWTAPANGTVSLSMTPPSTVLLFSVYTGIDLRSLESVRLDGDSSDSSSFNFTTRAGVNYHIRVIAADRFELRLAFAPPAANDNFANAIPISGENPQINGSTEMASSEDGEPRLSSQDAKTLWWRWTAPKNGIALLTLTNTVSLPAIDIFSGANLTNLILIAYNQPTWPNLSEVPATETYFQTVAGEIYDIRVRDFAGNSKKAFEIQFSYESPPVNDDFVNRIPIIGPFTNVTGTNNAATFELGEPSGADTSGGSIWWSYVAPENGLLRLRPNGANSAIMSVYTGDALTTLQFVASNEQGYETYLHVARGVEYKIAANGRNGQRGTIQFTLRFDANPSNDDFVKASVLTGSMSILSGNDILATSEPGEPLISYFSPQGSVWWSWTSPERALVRVNPLPGYERPLLAVERGNNWIDLDRFQTLWNSNDPLIFVAEAGVPYHLSVHNNGEHLDSWGDYAFQLVASAVTLIKPTNGVTLATPGTLLLEANVTDFDGPQKRVEFYVDGNKLGETTQPPWQFKWDSPLLGDHKFEARAVNPDGVIRVSFPVTNTFILANDRFAERLPLTGAYVSTNLPITGATTEEGETEPWGGGTIWLDWTAHSSGSTHLLANYYGGFTGPGVAVYTGNKLGDLNLVVAAANTNHWDTGLEFNAIAGTTYKIALIQRADFVNVHFEIIPAVANNDFASRVLIGTNRVVYGFTRGGTRESGEPMHAGTSNALGQTIWWSWTASSNAVVSISVSGGQSVNGDYFTIIPIVAAYTGDVLSNLVPVASAASTSDRPAALSFAAISGTTYSIAVDLGRAVNQWQNGWINEGFGADVVLRLEFDVPPLVTLTAPIDGTVFSKGSNVIFQTAISDPDSNIAHVDFFSGNVLLGTLTKPPFNFILTNPATGPATLHFEATDDLGGVGVSQFSSIFVRSTNALNDRFVDRFDLGGEPIALLTGNISDATHDIGEPNHGGFNGQGSVWWQWTAPVDGVLRLSSEQSTRSTIMAVYTGDALTNLRSVAVTHILPSDCFHIFYPQMETNLTFPVAAGTPYLLAVDSFYERTESPFRINLQFTSLRMVSPEEARYRVPESIPLAATFDKNLEGMFESVEFWDGTNRVGTAVPADSVFTWNNPPPGHYLIRPVATNRKGELIEGFPQSIRNGISANDDFASAIAFATMPADLTGNNIGATSEPGEARASGGALGQTLWWRWTAPSSGSVAIHSAEGSFRPEMDVFTGSTLTNLSLVATSSYIECAATGCLGEICRERQRQRILFGVSAGITYFIAIDGYRHDVCNGPSYDAAGEFSIKIEFHPLMNDQFQRRTVLSGYSVTVTNDNIEATWEIGEPFQGTNTVGRSVWYDWTTPTSGPVSVTRDGSSIPSQDPGYNQGGGLVITWINAPAACTVLSEMPPVNSFGPIFSIYTGEILSDLKEVGSGDRVDFDAVAGKIYSIAVTGAGDATGEFSLHLKQQHPPENDSFARRLLLQGSSVQVDASNLGATREPGEPQHASSTNDLHSVWWTWTAPSSGTIRLSARNYYYQDMPVRVYVGDSFPALVPVTDQSDFSPVFFYALAGSTYQIAVVGAFSGTEFQGGFTLSLTGPPAPAEVSLMNSGAQPGGGFEVGVAGQKGQSFVLQRSYDLEYWENIMTDTVLDGVAMFLDRDAQSSSERFYRAIPLDSPLARPPLHIQHAALATNHGFPVILHGSTGENYLLQASTNLINWVDLNQGTLSDNSLNWIDSDADIYPARFYRLLRLP